MTKIIGHRGAAGLALENTAQSFRRAIKEGVDAIEFDVRKTKDDQLVILHDQTTGRIAQKSLRASSSTLAELQQITLNNDERLLSLDEALAIIGSLPVIIEPKDTDTAQLIVDALRRHPKASVTFTSFLHDELAKIQQLLPDLPIFASEHFDPVQIVHRARGLRADGITLNKWLINPLTYYLAKRNGLPLWLYSVNRLWVARLLLKLYPNVGFYTDRPDLLQSLRSKKKQ